MRIAIRRVTGFGGVVVIPVKHNVGGVTVELCANFWDNCDIG